jgi:hypothetical protein
VLGGRGLGSSSIAVSCAFWWLEGWWEQVVGRACCSLVEGLLTYKKDQQQQTKRHISTTIKRRTPSPTCFEGIPLGGSSLEDSMAPTTRAASIWAAAHVFALVELCAVIAKHSGVVGACRLKLVCKATLQGAGEWLGTLPGLVVCGGRVSRGPPGVLTRQVWRLDLGKLRWERMPDLTRERAGHACCAVRKGVAVLGGAVVGQAGPEITASVEVLGSASSAAGEIIFKALAPLSCGASYGSAVVPINEGESERGQVLLIGGLDEHGVASSAVHLVDLATGVCTAQASLLSPPGGLVDSHVAGRLLDGRIVCARRTRQLTAQEAAQVMEPPPHGSPSEASWRWRSLPNPSAVHLGGGGCVLSDGRFAIFGGTTASNAISSSCAALTLDADGERWDVLPSMHEARRALVCAAIGGCVIVAGGWGSITAEVYEEGLGRWRRLPCSLPFDTELCGAGSAVM